MDTVQLKKIYSKHPSVVAFDKILEKKTVRNILLEGLYCSSMPLVFSALRFKSKSENVLFVLPDADEAGYLYHDLVQLVGPDGVLFFPSGYKRAAKYGQRDSANEILRTEVLSRVNEKGLFIVTHATALAEMVVSKQIVDDRQIVISRGDEYEMVELEHRLRDLGFQQQDYVYEPGQFSIRGSILDVYSYSSELPFRIDFFGDEVDTIRTFEVTDQLSKEQKDKVTIVPELSSVKDKKQSLLSFMSDDTIVVTKDLEQVSSIIDDTYKDGFSHQAIQEKLAGMPENEQQSYLDDMRKESQLLQASVFDKEIKNYKVVEYSALKPKKSDAIVKFNITPQPIFHKNFDLLKQSLIDWFSGGYKLYVLAESKKQMERLHDIISASEGDDFARKLVQVETIVKNESPDHTGITLHEGFVDNDLEVCLITDHQIFDRFHKYNLKSDKARAGKMALTMKELQEMEVGDYVVHVDYGIGKFMGLMKVPSGNSYQEVIRLQYQRGDKVDVSIHSLYKISKYRSGKSEEEPRMSVLGSGAWDRLKEKAKKRIKDIARDLIRLYAKRKHERGYAYSPDSYLQHELEASFLYEDTPDQIKTTQDVKLDMQKSAPMDRLVCGDVGFGKTEIAIRAAFKAACDSKQTAVLVPTTVLAFQHYRTFKKRLENFPVRVEYLSRARTAKQTRLILEDLEAGKVDILIGTHKLIGKTVKWHDLGLLVIDEEQKFGVSTKEKLRQLKTNVDTLTMSATPIPRTLQFSLMGARDMSIMRTPPPNRHPIHTQLGTYGHEIITDAINFEMSRNGQVYFVNPRISNLIEIKNLIERYIPDCRVAIGHGRLSPEELENIIVGFMNYDYDVLLSTTIVENGIDISNANTIIINDAHKFGLSDLHQMRGRVGRSNRKAFCFLLSPPLHFLNNDARKRLEAMETFSDLGSGFALAMQDLDLRGAGNLLGAEQSGFMEDLGYETYQKILKQAMAELRNEQPVVDEDKSNATPVNEDAMTSRNPVDVSYLTGSDFVEDCAVDSDLEMFFPELYVPGSAERMLLYRELDRIESEQELQEYRNRMIDRFGDVPHEGEELMKVVLLRHLGKQLGCEKVILRNGLLQMQLVANQDSPYYRTDSFGKIIGYITANARRCQLKEVKGSPRVVVGQVATVGEAVEILKRIEK